MAIYGLKYYEADQEGYYRLYYRRKPWARITPLPNDVYYNPPAMKWEPGAYSHQGFDWRWAAVHRKIAWVRHSTITKVGKRDER